MKWQHVYILFTNPCLLYPADIDECSLGIHQCHPNSKCINKPGWYVCECLPGFRNRRDDLEDNHSSQLQCIGKLTAATRLIQYLR